MHAESSEANASPSGGGNVDGQAAQPAQARLETVPLADSHRRADFTCVRSSRVQDFLRTDPLGLIKHKYARVFVLPSLDDPNLIWGYYTLSAAVAIRNGTGNKHQKTLPGGIPLPMALIGYMGRDDAAPKGLGQTLIVDAARRVARIEDLGIWGLTLTAETQGLIPFYEKAGFKLMRTDKDASVPARTFYGALETFLV